MKLGDFSFYGWKPWAQFRLDCQSSSWAQALKQKWALSISNPETFISSRDRPSGQRDQLLAAAGAAVLHNRLQEGRTEGGHVARRKIGRLLKRGCRDKLHPTQFLTLWCFPYFFLLVVVAKLVRCELFNVTWYVFFANKSLPRPKHFVHLRSHEGWHFADL